MSSKLAWHFQGIPTWAPAIINSDYVKLIDPPATNPFPTRRVIGRIFMPDADSNALIMQGSAGADQYYSRCRAGYESAGYCHAFEGPNEPPVATPEQRAALVAFTRRWVQLMHGHNPPLKTVALCLSVGWPDTGQASSLAGSLEATDYWAVHEYSAPTMQSDQGWLCLRYRRTVQELRSAGARIPPLFITECGIDGGVINRPGAGWKSFTDRAGYLSQLVWYDGELRRDDYVQAATIFTSGPNWNWMDFDADELLSRDLAAYVLQQLPTILPPPPPPPAPLPTSIDFNLKRPLPDNVGWVSQWFGESTDDTGEVGLAGHNGLDYKAAAGTNVLAAHAGQCSLGQDDGYGIFVRVTAPGDAFSTLYAHLQDATVSEGQMVSALQVIGHVGSTGKSSEPHLHLGWRVNGVTNPAYANWLDPYLGRKLNGDA